MHPLTTLIGLLWASIPLWPPSALIPLLAARTHVLLAGLPRPQREHREVVPDHHTLRTLAGAAHYALVPHPELAAAVEKLVGRCEEAHWYGDEAPDARALLARERDLRGAVS